jgi:TPR repeat protein
MANARLPRLSFSAVNIHSRAGNTARNWVVGKETNVACIDMDSLAQYEQDAKRGRADALYNLGLAYSTGQGVAADYVAAHKWFNLAAARGVEEAKRWRNQIAGEMNPGQIAQAQKLAREWLSIFK